MKLKIHERRALVALLLGGSISTQEVFGLGRLCSLVASLNGVSSHCRDILGSEYTVEGQSQTTGRETPLTLAASLCSWGHTLLRTWYKMDEELSLPLHVTAGSLQSSSLCMILALHGNTKESKGILVIQPL